MGLGEGAFLDLYIHPSNANSLLKEIDLPLQAQEHLPLTGVQLTLIGIAQAEKDLSTACLAFLKAAIVAVPALLIGFIFQEGNRLVSLPSAFMLLFCRGLCVSLPKGSPPTQCYRWGLAWPWKVVST